MSSSRTPPGLKRGRKRGRKKQPALVARELTGRKYLQILHSYVRRLHELYPHPNRVLFYDDVIISYLLAFFNPQVRSLRLIEDASQVSGINQYLNVDAVCRSTLSDANLLFDPIHLGGLIADLRKDLPDCNRGPDSMTQDRALVELLDKAVLVDGSFFRLAADVQWVVHRTNQHHKDKPAIGTVRLNCQYCLKSGVPIGVSINGSDGIHESTAAEPFIEPGHLYVFDAGIVSFDYLSKILASNSHLLCNLASKVNFTILTDRELTADDRAAGVLSDRVGMLSGSNAHTPPNAMLREVTVQYTDRTGGVKQLRLLTDLLDLSAKDVAQLYSKRWQIELFFRWLKISANFSHLCSHSRNGISLSFHVAVIAALLMVLRTQRPLSIYSYNLLSFVASGQADLQNILPILENRERQRKLEKDRLARKRQAQKSA